MRTKGDSVAAFLLWCIAGAGFCLGMLAILSIGAFVLLATFVLSGFLLWRLEWGWGMAGLLSGAALPVLYVAWINRGGPGEVCTGDARAITCTDEYSPWPFVVAGAVLALVGVIAFVRGRRST